MLNYDPQLLHPNKQNVAHFKTKVDYFSSPLPNTTITINPPARWYFEVFVVAGVLLGGLYQSIPTISLVKLDRDLV